MWLQQFIINDIKPVNVNAKIGDLKLLFNELTYSHIPIENVGVYLGCISENDAHCLENELIVKDCNYALEGFYVRNTTNWLDVLETFAKNSCNIMPVLDEHNTYLGYYELNDIIGLFSETPFFAEPGSILIIEKGVQDYSFSEISQIVESNNGKILGTFVSKIESDVVQITLKIGNTGLNHVIHSFRRYGYNIVRGHEEDTYAENLKERSEYLKKYLNI
ncbi:MAG TPA: CBS domain-containing protein [Flavobacteriaceae bacterium]|nr:CBS domain-containing protein [Flavobacteriaceae bacterium]